MKGCRRCLVFHWPFALPSAFLCFGVRGAGEKVGEDGVRKTVSVLPICGFR